MTLATRLLLAAILFTAHAHCATLRQYGRDWLIAGEAALHADPSPGRRITAKSVFIAPDFKQTRCPHGQREDADGACVKVVRVSQTAQLDFLLQQLNAMYGSAETPFGAGSNPLAGVEVKPQDAPHEGLKPPPIPSFETKPQDAPYDSPKPLPRPSFETKPQNVPNDRPNPFPSQSFETKPTPYGEQRPLISPSVDAKPQNAPYDGPKPQQNPFGIVVNLGKDDAIKQEQLDVGDVIPPKAEPCIELPKGEDASTLSTSVSTTELSTPSNSAETLSVAASVLVGSTSAMPSSTVVVAGVETTEGTSAQVPEVLVITESELESVAFVNESIVVRNETVPVLSAEEGLVEDTSSGDRPLLEINDHTVKDVFDVIIPIKEQVFAESSITEHEEEESSTRVSVSVSVPVNPPDKNVSVDVAEEYAPTSTTESTTAVAEDASDDYGEILVEPELGSGERYAERDVAHVSTDLDLGEMLELNNTSQVDKVLPVRNIIPEASSERIQFVDSPITNIQPVRNTYPGGDTILDIDLRPNDNANGANLQVHNLNPSKLVPPKFVETPMKIPDGPFSLDDFLNRPPVPPIPVYRPYENLNFNPQQQHFPLQYQQHPPRNGFVRFPGERDQVFHADQRVNSVRFPPGQPFNDEQVRQWPQGWRLDTRRVQRPSPVMRFWNKMPLIRNVEEANQRYQQDRRRPPPQYYQ